MKKFTLFLALLFMVAFNLNAQWTVQTSGVTSILRSVSVVNSNVAFISGDAGKILKTTNGGMTWTNIAATPIPTTMGVDVVRAIDENTILVAGTPANTFVYKTTNSGITWTQVFTQVGGYIDDIQFKDANNGFMYGDPVGSRWSLWKTTNGGTTWDSTGLYLPQVASEAGWDNAMCLRGNNIWFGTNAAHIYRSTNFGASWISTNTPGLTQSTSITFSGNTGFVTGSGIILKSTDAGATFSTFTAPGTGGNVHLQSLDTRYWIAQTNIYYSTNSGSTFSLSYTYGSQTTGPIWNIGANVTGSQLTVYATGYAGGIWKYTETLPTPSFNYPSNVCSYGLIPAYPSGVWANGNAILGDTLYITGGSSTGSASTVVQRYAINTNIFSLGTVLPEAKAGHSLVKAGNALYLIGGGATVSTAGTTCYKYTPSEGWTSIAPLPSGRSGHGAVNWGDSVIFVMGGPYSAPLTTVYYYRIATNTWGTTTSCLTARRTAAYGIVGNKLIIMAGYNSGFYKNVQIGTIGSDASTITWAAGPDIPFTKAGTSRPGGVGIGERFYFVTGETTPAPVQCDSIFVFNATTNSWLPEVLTGRGTSGTSSNYWDAVDAFVSTSGKVKLLIGGGSLTGATNPGLYTVQVDPCIITNIGSDEIPVNFSLSQNYPNPFNPVTKINFALPKSGMVTLKVYDVLGKEVATLVNEIKNAGTYSVDFNASTFSSGIYFYKIETNGFSSVKKMMLIK